MVKCILLFHVFVKSYQTNEFPYLPTILNARLNIPSLQTLFIWFHFIRFSIFCYALDLVDSYAKIMIKIGSSKLNTHNGITCHIKKYLETDNNLSTFFKIREHYLINWIFVAFGPLDDELDDSLSTCLFRGRLHNINS